MTAFGGSNELVAGSRAGTAFLMLVAPSGDGNTANMAFDVVIEPNEDPNAFSTEIAELDGVSEVVLIASKSDVDY